MRSYTVSSKARRDLVEIWKYIAQDNLDAADSLLERFYRVFALLGNQPGVGTSSEGIGPGIRRFPVGKYLVCYRQTQRGVQILHVFHGQRNQSDIFRTPE